MSSQEELDRIDAEILDRINGRLRFVQEVTDLDPGDLIDDRVVRRLISRNDGPLRPEALTEIFRRIIAATREVQRPRQVGFLGPEATFTHRAAIQHFKGSGRFVPLASIREVFRQVEGEAVHYGVVPVENSIEGAVNHTLDLFFESDLKVCGEVYLPISHDLLSLTDTFSGIQRVYSHPHAIAQCREWLRTHLPLAELVEVGSTAEAARRAAGEAEAAAVAGRQAAHLYGLAIVASGIEDYPRNVTRFLIIGRDRIPPTGSDKTSLMFVTSHVPGALYAALRPLAEAGLNMVKLESRPTKHAKWSYFFFVDIDGHIDDPLIRETTDRMNACCQYLKWLGSYPKDPSEVG